MKKNITIFITLLLLSACGQKESNSKEQGQMVGNDKDAHGCIASAGYIWSALQKECVRPWEAGITLSPSNEGQTTNAYIIKKADEAELFLPDQQGSLIMKKTSEATYSVSDYTFDGTSLKVKNTVKYTLK
ncbi:hypothetical protein [Flammeovirga pacifica]|uniref:Lipoprotein n=1 Tax=Flammeovirga pacifica TaxID=915059 RepID=A0A1S1YUK1_FLAPC|nr:hypothetical protein [Flammeovirga pacifica]OHX64543.1 hypothetical protein NH26_23505 [Flammeovirga pacifica]